MEEEVNKVTTATPCSSEDDTIVTKVTTPSTPPFLPRTPPTAIISTMEKAFLPVTVVMRLACGTPMESVLLILKDTELTWPVLLVRKKEWTNKRAVKIALHKELASWLPVMDSSLRHPIIKLYH
jgi:hypothetical protein